MTAIVCFNNSLVTDADVNFLQYFTTSYWLFFVKIQMPRNLSIINRSGRVGLGHGDTSREFFKMEIWNFIRNGHPIITDMTCHNMPFKNALLNMDTVSKPTNLSGGKRNSPAVLYFIWRTVVPDTFRLIMIFTQAWLTPPSSFDSQNIINLPRETTQQQVVIVHRNDCRYLTGVSVFNS